MASLSTKRKYPKLLYKKGKAPSQKKSMSYYSYLSNFQMVENGVGVDAWDALKKSSVGVIPRFYELDYTWSAMIVHYVLTHRLVLGKKYEIWSLIDWQPIRLSLIEFGFITGLNCEPFQDGAVCDVDHTDFWTELNVCPLVGPNLNELRDVLGRCKTWSFEKRRMVGWLCILHLGIYGIAPTSRISLEVAKRVLDLEAFERYPWGRVAWAYESIIGLGEKYGNKIAGEEVPLLSWGGSRTRFHFDDFIRQEKKAHEDKVRVSHFLSYNDGNMMPKWDIEVEDQELNNLINDIRQDCVDREAWDVIAAPISKRKNRKEDFPLSDSENYATKKKKNKQPIGDSLHVDSSTGHDNEMVNNAVFAMFKTLTEKVDNMETNLGTKLLSGMDAAIDTKVKALFTPFTEKLNTLEKEIEKLRQKNVPADPKEVANSNANTNEEVTSKDMSWMVQMKTTSQNDLPICVVKTLKKAGKKKADEKKVVKTEIQVPHLLDLSSGETYTDPLQHDIFKGVTGNLDAIVAKVTKSTNPTPLPKRQTKLAPTQLLPFVGNSTVKRIITGVTPSVTAYDPFADVDNSKIQNLLHFQLDTEEEPDGTNESSVEFYNIITTPRDSWSTDTYGWLTSSHMWCAMHIFHQRSLREPSLYHSQRIVFLDQWFVNKLVRDYKEFNAKTWTATDDYKGAFNGTYPTDSATNKKWLHDVDHLYACHFINGNHWVALDIDIGKETIHVYDSILNLVEDDKVIRNECRQFAKMVPAILNAMVPTCVRKRSDKQFAVRRLRNVPQNEKPGDCGVYAIKYIECLAIGCTFEGLNDRNIPQLRKKLAAEIYDEIGLPRMTQK